MRRSLAFALSAALGFACSSRAADDTWDGTWVGDAPDAGFGVQLIFAGNNLIGFFWNGDYLDVRAIYSTFDGVVTVTWNRGQAIVTRDGPRQAHMQVFQRGLADQIVSVMIEE
jgi:hypothetical protein